MDELQGRQVSTAEATLTNAPFFLKNAQIYIDTLNTEIGNQSHSYLLRLTKQLQLGYDRVTLVVT